MTLDPLRVREVLYGVSLGNNEVAICSDFVFSKEPSDGLEPSTPSLPCPESLVRTGLPSAARPSWKLAPLSVERSFC